MSNTKKTIGEKLAAAQRAQDNMTIYLPGPARAEWTRVKAEYDRIKAADAGAMLNPNPELKKLAAQLGELEEQMREDSIDLTVQSLRRQRTPATPKDERTWRELCDEHPPRKGKDGKIEPDDSPGVNMQTFPEALIRHSVIEPDLTAEHWDQLLYDVMTEAQFDALFALSWRLNKNPVDVPFSFAASKTLNSGTASRRQNGSGSRSAASKAGNQKR
jgi:hypothetical protein